jgi:hypothetical protein
MGLLVDNEVMHLQRPGGEGQKASVAGMGGETF